ncbi:HutD family protein [Undibacterium sp. TS12]|uniref:HutD/Ves family protein n=1 Tax=Undibacterium sp. TS12 TaxID=2908202 RepID=UPI001F4C6EB7|nr:HutD family protein [Undibacterium sp. TS12]MCH8622182.1 HutD family protein [Undibacterium sp. TS12]
MPKLTARSASKLTHKWSKQDYQTMPWKNGGGSTTELAVFPAGAGLEHFVWRLSTATVSSNGPFSHFAQIDRTLAILSGDGLILHGDSEQAHGSSVFLKKDSLPHQFRGETPINAELLHGTVLDLNMMTRRDVCTHHMQRLGAGNHLIEADDAQQLLLFCAEGEAELSTGETLKDHDCYLFEEEHEHGGIRLKLRAAEEAVLYLVRIQFLSMGDS